MIKRSGCEAYQMSDQKVCDRCGLVWDMNTLEPPECLTDEQFHFRLNSKTDNITGEKIYNIEPVSEAEQRKINQRGIDNLKRILK